jgi:hypothetical protein
MAVPPLPGLWNWPNPLPDSEFDESQIEAHLVVDTGGWLFGRMSVIPAAAVRVVNHDSKTVQIDLTKQQIKDAPEFDHTAGYGPYRDPATEYYGPMM